MKKHQNFLSESVHFFVVNFSVYLNRQVFVMGATFYDHIVITLY